MTTTVEDLATWKRCMGGTPRSWLDVVLARGDDPWDLLANIYYFNEPPRYSRETWDAVRRSLKAEMDKTYKASDGSTWDVDGSYMPPIPLRGFDWCANEEGCEEGPYAYGATREACVDEIEVLIEERTEAPVSESDTNPKGTQ